jgi:hypothetical protein
VQFVLHHGSEAAQSVFVSIAPGSEKLRNFNF